MRIDTFGEQNSTNQGSGFDLGRLNQQTPYTFQNVPFHTHNGIDSPNVYQPQITYTGTVTYLGQAFRNLPFPDGWSVARAGTGVYSVTHGLNTLLYTVMVTQLLTTPPDALAIPIVIDLSAIGFTVRWFSAVDGSPQDTAFMFNLHQVNNPGNGFPSYNLVPSQ
jgi:hypothetical protein